MFAIRLGLLHVRIHTLLDLQLDGLDLRGLGELRADDAVPESGDGVACLSHLLHFVPGTVAGSRVRHGMSMVTVSRNLKDKWALGLNRAIFDSKSCSLSHRKYIHAINPDARNVVTTLEKVTLSTMMSFLACSHCIVIVLTDEYCRKVPQLGQVKGLVHLALISSSVTVETEIDSSISLVLVSKGNTGSKGNLSSYDSIASIEVLGIHVH